MPTRQIVCPDISAVCGTLDIQAQGLAPPEGSSQAHRCLQWISNVPRFDTNPSHVHANAAYGLGVRLVDILLVFVISTTSSVVSVYVNGTERHRSHCGWQMLVR